jgi:hypothetical protein
MAGKRHGMCELAFEVKKAVENEKKRRQPQKSAR